MFSGDTKRIWFPFAARDYQAMITMLEEQALQGWRVKKINSHNVLMERVRPGEIKYFVEIFTEKSQPDLYSHPDFKNWIEEREASGYGFAGHNGQLVFFHNDTEQKPAEPFSAEGDAPKKFLNSSALRSNYFYLLGAPFVSFLFYYLLFFADFILFSLYNGFSFLFLLALSPLMVMMPVFFEEIRKIRFYNRLVKSINEGAHFEHTTVSKAKKRKYVLEIPFVLFFLSFIVLFITEQKSFLMILLLSLPIVMSFVIGNLKTNIARKKVMSVMMVFIITIGGNIVNMTIDNNSTDPDSIPNDVSLITLFDLTNEPPSEYRKTYYKESGHLLVPLNVNYHEYDQDKIFYFNYYKAINKNVAELLFKKMSQSYDSKYVYLLSPGEHNFDDVLAFTEAQRYIIIHENIVINTMHNTEFSQEDLFSKIEESLFIDN